MSDELKEHAELYQLFNDFESLLKKYENITKEIFVPALNQIRYAYHHTLKGINLNDNKEFNKAKNHIDRAMYDCHEALRLFCTGQFCDIQKKYSGHLDIVQEFVPLYPKAKEAAIQTQKEINQTQNSNKDRYTQYQSVEQHWQIIYEFLNAMIFNQDAIEDKIKKSDKSNKRYLIFGICGVIGVIFTAFNLIIRFV